MTRSLLSGVRAKSFTHPCAVTIVRTCWERSLTERKSNLYRTLRGQHVQNHHHHHHTKTSDPGRVKPAAAWTSLMFLYIYVDYLHLYKPGFVDDILASIVWEFDISPTLSSLRSRSWPSRAS